MPIRSRPRRHVSQTQARARAAAACGAETARHIQQAIDQLPPEQRLTVVLCDVQGLSYDEAAQTMAVELGTVKSRLSRARAQLRVMLSEKGELPAASARLQREARDAAPRPTSTTTISPR